MERDNVGTGAEKANIGESPKINIDFSMQALRRKYRVLDFKLVISGIERVTIEIYRDIKVGDVSLPPIKHEMTFPINPHHFVTKTHDASDLAAHENAKKGIFISTVNIFDPEYNIVLKEAYYKLADAFGEDKVLNPFGPRQNDPAPAVAALKADAA